jgi:hypothetical protein
MAVRLVGPGSALNVRAGEFLDDRLGSRTVPIFLLMRPDVQADLNLEPIQVAEARRTAADLYYKARALRGQTGPALIAARRTIDGEESLWLSRHLSELQFKRLREIDLQWEGVAAMLNRPFVTDYLGLSATQKQELARRLSQHKPSVTGQPRLTPAEHERLANQAITVLTDHQRQLWNNLLGRQCRFSIAPAAPASGETAVPVQGNTATSIPARGAR